MCNNLPKPKTPPFELIASVVTSRQKSVPKQNNKKSQIFRWYLRVIPIKPYWSSKISIGTRFRYAYTERHPCVTNFWTCTFKIILPGRHFMNRYSRFTQSQACLPVVANSSALWAHVCAVLLQVLLTIDLYSYTRYAHCQSVTVLISR